MGRCRRKGVCVGRGGHRREGRGREGERVGGRETCISVNMSPCMQQASPTGSVVDHWTLCIRRSYYVLM